MKATDSALSDFRYMRRALGQQAKGIGRTFPNPSVGCVIVSPDGKIIGQGYHRAAGKPHAEIEALAAVKKKAPDRIAGSTVYVTLEPCNHHGKTPPCTDALLAERVGRVVYGCADPNARATGGLERLQQAGVTVTGPVLESECLRGIGDFRAWQQGRPYVTLKYAMTLDGATATVQGDSKWITGQEARTQAHRLRSVHDAIVIGKTTLLADDPELTVRHIRSRKQPARVVLARTLPVRTDLNLYRTAREVPTHVFFREGADATVAELQRMGVVLHADPLRDPLDALLGGAIGLGWGRLMVEGGGTVTRAFHDRHAVDEVHAFVAPSLLGGPGKPPIAGGALASLDAIKPLHDVTVTRWGDDIEIAGFFRAEGAVSADPL